LSRSRRRNRSGRHRRSERPESERSPRGPSTLRNLVVLTLAAVASAAGLIWLTLQRVPLGLRPTYLGKSYAELAADPFHPAPDNPVALRILAPLLSYAVGLRGPYILWTNLITVAVFLAAVFLWFRSAGLGSWAALVGSSTLAFSTVVLTTLHYGGYPDTLTYLFVLLAFWASARPWLCGVLFFLALLNHEGAAFLAPWLLVVLARRRPRDPRRWLRASARIVATLGAFAVVRWLQSRAHPGAEFSLQYYLAPLLEDPLTWFRESARFRGVGILSAFNLFWALPLVAAIIMLRRGERVEALTLVLPIPLALAQLLVAYDVTRVATLAFPSVLLGAAYLLKTNAYAAQWWIPALVVANFFIPQVNVAMGVMDRMGPK